MTFFKQSKSMETKSFIQQIFIIILPNSVCAKKWEKSRLRTKMDSEIYVAYIRK